MLGERNELDIDHRKTSFAIDGCMKNDGAISNMRSQEVDVNFLPAEPFAMPRTI